MAQDLLNPPSKEELEEGEKAEELFKKVFSGYTAILNNKLTMNLQKDDLRTMVDDFVDNSFKDIMHETSSHA
jgi:hypothetical protein